MAGLYRRRRPYRQVADLKEELKRLGRTVATLKDKNVVLLERNGTLERRNAKMRQHNKAIVEKNRKLLSMLKRELGGGGDSDASGEGSDSVSTVYQKKKYTSSSDGAENTRTGPSLASEHCSAHPEDTVPRRKNGPQRHSDVDPGDEEYIATPGRANGGKHLVAGGDGVGTVVEDGRRPQDREEAPNYNRNGETSGGDSNAKTKEQRERRRAVAASVEVSRSARRSGSHVLLSRVPLGTSTRPSNPSSSDKSLLAKSNGSSSSSSSSSSNQRKKIAPRLTLGAKEGRLQEIVEVSRDVSRRRVGRPSSAPRHAVSRCSEGVAVTSDTKVTPHASSGDRDNSPTRESIIAGEKHAVFSPGFQGVQKVEYRRVKSEGVDDGEGDKKQQQWRRKKRDEVLTGAGRYCEWRLSKNRRSDSDSESNDEVSSAPVWGRVEGGGWRREGTGDGSSGIPKTTPRDGVYAPLAMATVHSPKKNGSSVRLREQQQPKHEGDQNLNRQREREPECPLPKDPRVETLTSTSTSTTVEEKTSTTAADADGGDGNSRLVLPDTANVRTNIAPRAKDDPRWQENGVGTVPGARSERKRPIPRSTVEIDDEVDGEELPCPPRRKHRPEKEKSVKTNEESGKPIGGEVRADRMHEERESTAGGGNAGTVEAGQRSFVSNPYRCGGGDRRDGRGNEGREEGVPQRPQQKYKYQEVSEPFQVFCFSSTVICVR